MIRLRAVLLWALLLCVSFQGVAAVAMASCAAHSAGPSTVSTLPTLSITSVATQAEQAPAMPCDCCDPASQHAVLKATQTQPGDTTADADHSAGNFCGDCAACPMAALATVAPAAAFYRLPAAQPAEASAAWPTVSVRPLDKPPRA